jgi:beta-N-acetylhexosaminidase
MKRKIKLIASLTGVIIFVFVGAVNYSIFKQFGKIEGFVDKRVPLDIVEEEPFTEDINLDVLAERIISRMSIEEKIGQLLMINYLGNDLSRVRILVESYHIGGFMLKSENIVNNNYRQVKANNRRIQHFASSIPIFLSVDQEGGSVARLRTIIDNYPSPLELYSLRGEEGVIELARYFSSRLKDLNIHINFAPVMDVIEVNHSVVSGRVFSRNVDVNTRLSRVYLDIFNKSGVIAVPKHYPGYGRVGIDPHYEVCFDPIQDIDVISAPFREVIDAQMIMSAHVVYPNYDNKPGTLSEIIISGLRQKGFSNIIITDDIQMYSITDIYDYKTASKMALQAGCDIVLSITKDDKDWFDEAVNLHKYLVEAYKRGEIPPEKINLALKRVLRSKLKYLSSEKWAILNNEERIFIRSVSEKTVKGY